MSRLLKPHLKHYLLHKRTFYEPPRGGYPPLYHEPPEDLNFLQRLRKACSEFKDEFKVFTQELRHDYKLFPPAPAPEEPDIVWKFDGTQKSLNQWVVNSDSDYGHGYSIAKLELSPRGSGIFHGVLDTRPSKDGRTQKSGYCNITSIPKLKSFRRKDRYNWSLYNELVLRVRGDGRGYMLNLLHKGYFDIEQFIAHYYVMYTRGGPYWQTIKIPFAKFFYALKTNVHEHQYPVDLSVIDHFGITLADKKPGPFKLEIDYIAVSYNPNIFETFAYEMYEVPHRN